MKKMYALAVSLLFAFTALSQAPTSCSTAASLSYPISRTVPGYTDPYYWFKVTVDSGSYRIQVNNATIDREIDSAMTFVGSSCGSLTYLRTDTISDTNFFYISLYDTVTTTYYIKLHNNSALGTTFSLTTAPEVYIVGNMGYCPGQVIQLSACLINHSGTSTYTWTPTSYTTAIINIAPTATVPTTYTLNYHDAGGTVTTTVSIFPLPPAACKNCEMVQNGALESYQYRHNIWGNLLSPAVCPNNYGMPMSDPLAWVAPTCGTPDYFNGDFPYPSPLASQTGSPSWGSVSVPKNGFSSNTTAHSGRGYGGVTTWFAGKREYIQEPLKCPLVPGQLYNVSFYASLPDNYSVPPSTSNNLGAYLSVSTATNTGYFYLSYTPQVNNSNVITSIGSWTQVSGNITGNGEKYITVGNFFNDNQTNGFLNSQGSNPYYFIDDISVTPAPLVLSASTCQSGSVTITAFGAPSSTLTSWVGPGLFVASGSSITVASPTVATTYTCSVNLGASCSNCPQPNERVDFSPCLPCNVTTQTITIYPTPCSGTNPAYSPTVTAYTFSATPGYAASSIQVNSSTHYTISNTELRMASTASINVAPNGTLTISGSWLHVCNPCAGLMWPGIVVQNGGVLIVDNSIIEDATNAIHTASSTSTTPIPSYTVSNSIFNNNTTGIYVDSHQGNLSSNTVYNTVFTCRSLGSHTSSSISATKSDIALATPLLPSGANPTGLTLAGVRSRYGIFVNTVNAANPVTVGLKTQSNNIFDNLDFGVYASLSSLTVKNNVFQNLTGNSSGNAFGVGVYSSAFARGTIPVTTLIIGNSSIGVDNTETNYFKNCLRGVMSVDIRKLYINNNIFTNETTASTFTTAGSYVTGEYGVNNSGFAAGSGTVAPEQFQFANNSCSNYATGCFLDFSKLYNTSANSLYITTNTITGYVTGNQSCYYGIFLQQNSSNGANTGVPATAFNITANTITHVKTNCIYATAVNNSAATSGFLSISANTSLNVFYNSSATQSQKIAAVYLSGCYRTIVNSNNAITSGGTGAQHISGVYVYQSPYTTLNCNNATNMGQCYVFEGNCMGSDWEQNIANYAQYALVLRNTGYIGNQGGINHATLNQIGNTSNNNITVAQTLCDASDPSNGSTPGKLYVSTSACPASGSLSTVWLPCVNNAITGGVAYSTTGSTPTLLVTGSSGSPNLCSSGSGGGSGRMAAGADSAQTGAASAQIPDSVLQQLISPGPALPVYDHETRWGNQYFVSSTRPNFNAAQGYENAKTFALADAAIATGAYGTAQGLVAGITPGNTLEQNWQSTDNIINRLQSDSLNEANLSSLQSIAAQCPLTGGSIVWRARALVNAYYKTIIAYPHDCPENTGNSARIENTTGINNELEKRYSINLYPNPNNGQMQVDYKIADDVDLQVLDINGNLVCSYKLRADINTLNISNDKLSNGVYFYRMVKNNTIFKCQKLVIIK